LSPSFIQSSHQFWVVVPAQRGFRQEETEDISRWGEVLEGEGEKPFNFRLGGQIFFVKKTRGNTRCPRGGRANLRGGRKTKFDGAFRLYPSTPTLLKCPKNESAKNKCLGKNFTSIL